MKFYGKKQNVLHEYKLEIEKMCETLDDIMSLEKSETQRTLGKSCLEDGKKRDSVYILYKSKSTKKFYS